MNPALRPARLRPADVVRLGGAGLQARPGRAGLAAFGVAIGVAAMVAIIGISVSSGEQVRRQLDQLGTNLLRVTPAKDSEERTVPLPVASTAVVDRIGPVTATAEVAQLPLSVYRNDHVPTGLTGGIAVAAASSTLLDTVHATLATGSWFTPATRQFPAVVLGSAAARHLGVSRTGTSVRIGRYWCAVVGVLDPVSLAPEIDGAVLVGWPAAATYLGATGHPTTVYVRTDEGATDAVGAVLARSVAPSAPQYVAVDRPSDAIAARAAATSALSGLLLGLGAVALLVGGVGIANTMIVSVLQRRLEIGLRRALGATRRQIWAQFVIESVLLSLLGGVAGTVAGIVITSGYASLRAWPTVVPLWATGAGVGVTVLVGAVAGLQPAVRASRLSPTEALTAL